MVASTINKEQNMRPRILLGQIVQEDLKAFRICCRQDQKHTHPVFGTYRSIQVGELPNELAGDFRSYPLGSPTRSRAVHPTEPSFISKHNSQWATLSRCKKARLGHRSSKPFFFKVFLRLQIAVRMKRTRHQLAPVMTGQKIVDRAVACWMPDRFFIGCFQVVNIQELSRPCRFGKLLEKSLLLSQGHIFSYSTAARLWFQRVDPTIVVGHMRSIDCAQRYTRQFANLRLGFPIFPQQYHLDTLSNNRVGLALQRLFQALYLVLVALDHPLPPCESVRWSYRITFTKLWRAPLWRQMLTLVSVSGRYGSGITPCRRTEAK